LKYSLFWNGSLKYLIEGYTALSHASLEQIVLVDWTDPWSKAKNGIAIVTLVVCLVAPFSMTIYFRKNKAFFQRSQFRRKFI
jgi:hypothetical protein